MILCCAARPLHSPQSRVTPRLSDSHVFDEYVWRAERPLLGRELQLYGLAALSLSSKFQEDEAIFVEVCVCCVSVAS